MRTIFLMAAMSAVLAAQEPPAAVFGTTVVDTGGLQGTIYFLKPNTGILPPNWKHYKPKGTLYTRVLNVPPRDFMDGFPGVTSRFEWFAIDYTGKFWIEKPGVYRFAITSDDGSLFYIDGELLIDNDRIHPPQTREARVNLDRGTHSIRVTYFQGPRSGLALILEVAPPGQGLKIFNMDDFRPPSESTEIRPK